MKEITANTPQNKMRPGAVAIKGLIIFLVVDLLFILPWSRHLGKYTLYNWLIPGRTRFLGTTDLDALFSSHAVSRPKQADEFRVFFLGDSAVWGALMDYRLTTAARLDAARLETCSGKEIRIYNLASPEMSVYKDLMILDLAIKYQPDMVVWFVTLNSLGDFQRSVPDDDIRFANEVQAVSSQLDPPIVLYNMEQAISLAQRYNLVMDVPQPALENVWQRTLIGQRNHLADLLDVELAAFTWAALGDRRSRSYEPISDKLVNASLAWLDIKKPVSLEKFLRFDIFDAALAIAGEIPVLVVNNPMYIQNGESLSVRYNSVYPVWAYDQYRDLMQKRSGQSEWSYLDLWDAVPGDLFADSNFHRQPAGDVIIAERLGPAILKLSCP